MADADDMDSPEVEMEEENEADESSPAEEDGEAGEAGGEEGEGGEGDDEAQPVEEDGGEGGDNDEAGEGEENAEEESGEAEAAEQQEEAAEAAELEIRDEDEGRPVSSLSKKVKHSSEDDPQPSTSSHLLYSSQSVSFAPQPAAPAKAPGQNVIVKMIRGMWASREMLNESSDMQIVMKTTLRELIVYW